MDYLELEERLAIETVVYVSNPGPTEIEKLKEFYDVTIIPKTRQIRITYKQ